MIQLCCKLGTVLHSRLRWTVPLWMGHINIYSEWNTLQKLCFKLQNAMKNNNEKLYCDLILENLPNHLEYEEYYWRVSEASETLSGVYKFQLVWYMHI